MRTWIYYYSTEYLYPTSVTFTIQDTDYTFSGIGDRDWAETNDTGDTLEQMLIIYGDSSDNSSFLHAMRDWIGAYISDDETDDYDITMTIHGTSDVQATLGIGVALDYFMIVKAMSEIGGKLEDSGNAASTLKVTEHK